MIDKKISPAIKWAGGKTQLLNIITENLPDSYNNYYEPFIGGGAVLLSVKPEKTLINDINEQLINLYIQIRDSVDDVLNKINNLDSVPCTKEFYYSIREQYNQKILSGEKDAQAAALMIWLNKHCFNGLYRVNSKGLFNVPFNNRVKGKSVDESNIRAISDYLNQAKVNITCMDFEEACTTVSAGDFVYFDSPYVPESETAYFTDYAKGGFSLEDHKRLSKLFKCLDEKGAKIMLSNNDVPLVRELYEGYKIQSFAVKRMINRNANKRTGKEVLITNY
uniref:DNA adenine methylase n=1 Tax=uncultured Allisonella sp. TaxID=339338 RepID=UPI0025940CE8|nr:DNA adenine methylase [uncultured Allisonella sp.]